MFHRLCSTYCAAIRNSCRRDWIITGTENRRTGRVMPIAVALSACSIGQRVRRCVGCQSHNREHNYTVVPISTSCRVVVKPRHKLTRVPVRRWLLETALSAAQGRTRKIGIRRSFIKLRIRDICPLWSHAKLSTHLPTLTRPSIPTWYYLRVLCRRWLTRDHLFLTVVIEDRRPTALNSVSH